MLTLTVGDGIEIEVNVFEDNKLVPMIPESLQGDEEIMSEIHTKLYELSTEETELSF